MNAEEEIIINKSGESRPLALLHDLENDFDDDEGSFSRAHLGTVLRPGVVRPLSPTLKVHSPETVFPGIAMLCEGFDSMIEWRKMIEFVGFFARKGNMFNRRHHWDMRNKFIEVRLSCMEKILEDPPNNRSEGEFRVDIPVAVEKTTQEKNCENQDFSSSKHLVICDVQQGQNEDSSVQVDRADDEMLKRESLQEGLDMETRPETSWLDAERKHYSSNNDDMQDLVVVGKTILPRSSFITECVSGVQGLSEHSEIESEHSEKDFTSELVVEDLNDNDFQPVLPSCKLAQTRPACGKLFKQKAVNGVEKHRTLSRLQRLRRILFSCFRRNQVTPVDTSLLL